MNTLRNAAVAYFKEQHWATIPLGLDSGGFPKRPLPQAWQQATADKESLTALWRGFDPKGIGIVLGPCSDNVAVIDVDDQELGIEVTGALLFGHVKTRIVQTVRKRVHVYVQEETPSNSTRFFVTYKGRQVTIELKAQGTQVAAPPTPGYTLVATDPPIRVPTVRDAWVSIARKLGLDISPAASTSGYPPAWQKQVGKGERNNAIFIEAHRLREARMPLDDALDVMRLRVEGRYEAGDISWHEIERTVRSAYRSGEIAAQSAARRRFMGPIAS